MMPKPSTRYLMTDTLSLLAKSGQLSQEECESTAQMLLDGIEYFTPLRKVPLAEAGNAMLIQIDRAIREHHARPNMEADKITCRQGCAHSCLHCNRWRGSPFWLPTTTGRRPGTPRRCTSHCG